LLLHSISGLQGKALQDFSYFKSLRGQGAAASCGFRGALQCVARVGQFKTGHGPYKKTHAFLYSVICLHNRELYGDVKTSCGFT